MLDKALYINNQPSAFQKVSSALGFCLYAVAMPGMLIESREKDRGWLHKQFVYCSRILSIPPC